MYVLSHVFKGSLPYKLSLSSMRRNRRTNVSEQHSKLQVVRIVFYRHFMYRRALPCFQRLPSLQTFAKFNAEKQAHKRQ